ncbi:MAG: glycosyltransferase family 2 protein [Desulfobacterales bacterium]
MMLSVIIPCYNAQDTIGVQLEALTRQESHHPWEVIVADNRSTDASMEVVNSYSDRLPNLKIVDASRFQGTSYALNTAIAASTGNALVFCDADDMVGDEWLRRMGDALVDFDFVACGMETERLNSHLQKRSGFGNPQKTSVQKIWYPPYLPHVGGGTMGIKRVLHDAVGGFDEALPYLQDTDYCFKVQIQTRTEIHFVDSAVMHVRYRENPFDTYRQSKNYALYNVFLSKRYRFTAPAKTGLWRTYVNDWKSLIKLLFKGNFCSNQNVIAWRFGRQIGRLIGTLKYKVPPV